MWNALYVGHLREVAARDYVAMRGIEAYCPLINEQVRIRRRDGSYTVRNRDVPAYPRYIFARPDGLMRVASEAPLRVGKISVVRMDGEPVGIRDSVMSALAHMAQFADRALRVGQSVRLGGTLDGLVAIVSSVNKIATHGEVSVWLAMFGSVRKVSVPLQDISEDLIAA